MDIKAAEVAAYIGAAAWAPQIVHLLYSWLARPIVQIIPNKRLELGFTFFGPIFNIILNISSARKDVIIDQISVELVHEKGEVRKLIWTGMQETFSQITDNTGNKQFVERDQPAIALKLSTALLTEKFVRFQDLTFQEKLRPLENDLAKHAAAQQQQEWSFVSSVLKSREQNEIFDWYKANFWWKPGTYIARFGIRSRENAILESVAYQFELTQFDVEYLQKNQDLLKLHYENLFKVDAKRITWMWRNVAFNKIEAK